MRLRPVYKSLLPVVIFYAVIASLVFFPRLLGLLAYPVFILLAILFILTFNVKLRLDGFLTGAIAAAVSMCLICGIMLAFGWIGITSMNEPFFLILAVSVCFQMLVAFGEELPMRAYIFQALDDKLGLLPAVLLSAAGFAALHLSSMRMLGIDAVLSLIGLATIFMAGIVLALLYKFGGLFNAVAFHFAWNFLEYNIFSLGPLGGVFTVAVSGPELLTGGEFGPEASVLGLAGIIAVACILWTYYSRKRAPVNPERSAA